MFNAPSPARTFDSGSDPQIADLHAKAAHALGLVTGMLRCASPRQRALFARALVRRCLIHALRQERHGFTDARFAAWMAGTCTLSDEQNGHRPPRLVAEAVLAMLARSPWQPLAEAAIALRSALEAPTDVVGSIPDSLGAAENPDRLGAANAEAYLNERGSDIGPRAELGSIARAAEQLVADLKGDEGETALPLPVLDQLYASAGASVAFAPREAVVRRVTVAGIAHMVEEPAEPAPLWALDMIAGALLARTGALRPALPLPGLLRAEALRPDLEDEERALVRATALAEAAQGLLELCEQALVIDARIAALAAQERSSSRAPDCIAWLTTAGPLRSSQLEALLDATRLGVRGILGKLQEAELLTVETVAGVKLYGLVAETEPPSPALDDAPKRSGMAISKDTLAEYDAAMEGIDELLARTGGEIDEDE